MGKKKAKARIGVPSRFVACEVDGCWLPASKKTRRCFLHPQQHHLRLTSAECIELEKAGRTAKRAAPPPPRATSSTGSAAAPYENPAIAAMKRSAAKRAAVELAAAQRATTPPIVDGWEGHQFAPPPATCKWCGVPIPRTRKRGDAFGGHGRPRRFCSARCRQRDSRANRTGVDGRLL